MKKTNVALWICSLISMISIPVIGMIDTPRGLPPLWIWFEIPIVIMLFVALVYSVSEQQDEEVVIKDAPTPALKLLKNHPQITYAIMTATKEENRLEQTLESLEKTGFFDRPEHLPLRIIAGSSDCGYLEKYMYDSRFLVDPMSESEARQMRWKELGNALRRTAGHRRALDPKKVNPGSKYLMVFEDNVIFCKGWITRFERILEEVEKNYKEKFLLSLSVDGSQTSAIEAYRAGKLYIPLSYASFNTIQAMLYPFWVRDEYMSVTKMYPGELPHESAISKNMKAMEIPILTTAPSLVQKVGIQSVDSPSSKEVGSFVADLDSDLKNSA